MVELTKSQKIFFGGLAILIVTVICYYIITKSTSVDYTEFESENNIVIEEIESKEIIVHIIGAVVNEGIVKVKEGSRIADVIEEAGGTLSTVDFSKVNLAYIVQDGQKIYIPSIEDVEEETENNAYEYISSSSGTGVVIETEKEEGGISVNGMVNINTANQAELETLPGIGQSTASKIIEYRKQNKKFENIEDIKNVSGIGEAKFNGIKDKITI